MDDQRQSDPTSQVLTDFVRHVSEQVVLPGFTPGRKGVRPPRRHAPSGLGVLAAVAAAVAVIAAVALVVVYGPRSTRINPNRTPATQPGPAPTQPGPGSTSTTSVPIPAVTGTQQITYQPFTATGIEPSLNVTSHVTGTCIRYGGGAAGAVLLPVFR